MQHLIYAMNNGNLVHISEVERGLQCNCSCPACGEALIARKGNVMVHHFAHRSVQNCEYGYETSLHLMAKEILSEAKTMILPEVRIDFLSYKYPIQLCNAGEVPIDHVELEHKTGNVIPDVTVYANGKPFFVEIFVTHAIDEEKLKKLKNIGISTIEIDLSGIDHSITKEELSEILLGESGLKYWKYNAVADGYLDRFYQVADRRKIQWSVGYNQFIYCVERCPTHHGRTVSMLENCISCDYCVAHLDGALLCTGRQDIRTVKDLDRPYIEPGKDFTRSEDQPLWNQLYEQMNDQVKDPVNYEVKEKASQSVRETISDMTRTENGSSISDTISIIRSTLQEIPSISVSSPDKTDTWILPVDDIEIEHPVFDAILYTGGKPVGLKLLTCMADHILWEESDMPVLGIDLSMANQYITIVRFKNALIHDPILKCWLVPPTDF